MYGIAPPNPLHAESRNPLCLTLLACRAPDLDSLCESCSPAILMPREELGLSTCSSAGSSWCNLGVSVGVGGGIGLFGVLLICSGLCGLMSVAPSSRATPSLKSTAITCILVGVLWCLSWAAGVVIWGGQDGAMYVGIMWVLPILVTVAALYCAVSLRRAKDEQNIGG